MFETISTVINIDGVSTFPDQLTKDQVIIAIEDYYDLPRGSVVVNEISGFLDMHNNQRRYVVTELQDVEESDNESAID